MNFLVEVLTKEIAIKKEIDSFIKILLFSFLTFFGSLVKIFLPFTPVPVTLQTFFLFMAVYYLNPKEIGVSQSIYILAGMVGLPVFAAGLTGMLALVGPTAGYLLGFIIAGIIMAIIREKIKVTFFKIFCTFLLGIMIVYLFGIAHLCFIYKINIITAVKIGAIPFIAGDLIKISLASIASLKIKK